MNSQLAKISPWLTYAAWTIALMATAGSLGLSEFYHFVPCSLCWIQRILMFPLVLVLGIGILKRDDGIADYALPLAGLGTLVAAYHSLLQWGIIQEAITPCSAAADCSVRQLNFLGFVTIPFLSLLAFVAITGCLLVFRQQRAAQFAG